MTALYHDGNLKASEIYEKTDIPRTSVYMHLKDLEAKGYVARSKKGKILSFIPTKPENILNDLEAASSGFADILPLLSGLAQSYGKRPVISFFESRQGIEAVYRDMVRFSKKGDIVRVIETAETIKENLVRLSPRFMVSWQKQMVRRELLTKGIVIGPARDILSELPDRLKELLNQRTATVRLLDKPELSFAMNLYLAGNDKIYIFVPQKESVIKIESPEIYLSFVTLFELMYAQAKLIPLKELIR